MAETVVKLRVDSKDYDANIRSARQGLLSFEQQCRSMGTTLDSVERSEVEFANALGNMATSSRTTKGQLSELTSAFTDLSMMYKRMTDEEKESPMGQAMASSLETLKGRIQETKSNLDEVNKSINDTGKESESTGGALEGLSGKLGVNVKSLAAWGVALEAGKVALKVMQDAFFSNEEQLDEWGRVVASSESVYNGFLDAINTGDISGFLSRIDTIISAARDAYNALDELATYNAFNQINIERARVGLSDAINNYRGGKGSKESISSAGGEMKKQLSERQRKEQAAYEAEIKKVAQQRGVDPAMLRKALSGSYGDYAALKKIKYSKKVTKMIDAGDGIFIADTQMMPANEREKLGGALRRFNDTELERLQGLGAQAQRTGFEIEGVDRQVLRASSAKQPGSGGGGRRSSSRSSGGGGRRSSSRGSGSRRTSSRTKPSTPELTAEEWQKKLGLYDAPVPDFSSTIEELKGIAPAVEPLSLLLDDLTGVKDRIAEIQALLKEGGLGYMEAERLNEELAKLQSLDLKPVTVPLGSLPGEGDKTKESWQDAAKAVGAVGSALSQLDDPSAKVAGIVGEAIANIALGFASATSKDTKLGVWGWIAAIAGGLGTMISTISAIKSATSGSYEEGGIIPGNSYHGDKLLANVNSGELILNTAQQNNVAAALQSNYQNNQSALGLGVRVRGEDLFTALDNYQRRTGKRFSA